MEAWGLELWLELCLELRLRGGDGFEEGGEARVKVGIVEAGDCSREERDGRTEQSCDGGYGEGRGGHRGRE
jgi:hypothetical protein